MRLIWVKVPGAQAREGGSLLRARSDIQRHDGTHCCYEIVIYAWGAASLSGDLVDEISLYEDAEGAKAQAQRIEDENTVVAGSPRDPRGSITPVTLCSCCIEQAGDEYVATVNTTAWSRSHRTDNIRIAGSAIAYLLGFLTAGETPPPPPPETPPPSPLEVPTAT
ncbi:MAG: hypothetical protein AB7O32_00070 [Vicinamibacterales bacterium]